MPLALLPLALFLFATPPVSLFDGKTFHGWEGDTKNTFRIESGAIVGGSLDAKVPRNEFLCTTKEYGDFELRLKFKVLGKGANAGVQIRSRRVPNHHQLWINGRQTVDYTEPDEAIEQRGLIGLQIHGGQPSEAWYKDIVIEELDSK
ncbi:MAG: hypothetical protein B7Z73_12010 [Planctomycetia bacterium 21-64-5]|nr:MAG: hypothetical protein B7Z73_12010 [Planctomycetia bacterium 21-64-5]